MSVYFQYPQSGLRTLNLFDAEISEWRGDQVEDRREIGSFFYTGEPRCPLTSQFAPVSFHRDISNYLHCRFKSAIKSSRSMTLWNVVAK